MKKPINIIFMAVIAIMIGLMIAVPGWTRMGFHRGFIVTAYMKTILDDIDEATFKSTANLEAGTDFYSKTTTDTVFEVQLNNEAGFYAVISDVDNFLQDNEGFTGQVTVQAFPADDATPDVSLAALMTNNVYQTANANTTTITDFDDGDGAAHSEFQDGDWFILRVDDANTIIDFSANANIEGNAGVDFTGSTTQIVYLLFIYEDARWNCVNFTSGYSTPTTLAISTIQAAMKVYTYASAQTLIASQMNSYVRMTGAGDVDIPANQCDTATGKWLVVKSTAAHLNSVTSNDASDQFVLSDGTILTATHELDLAGAAGNQVCVTCTAANKWEVTGEIGTCVTGGVAD